MGIDTSGYANAIGVVDGKQVLADLVFEAKTDSLEKIVANIDFALKEAGLTLDDIQGLGVGLGPGSWTGIRVGVTAGKILAYSTNKLVAGVSTLEVLAYGVMDTGALICPVISTGAKDTVYAACYRSRNGNLERAGEYYVGDVPGLATTIKEPAVLVSAEAETCSRKISQTAGFSGGGITAIMGVPRGAAVASLAAARLERGESDDFLALTPLYLKESTARAFQGRHVRGKSRG
ncbi:tRNA (adenosine(37)-N6)-threonylcarbamoyltransferase complex dimerization subunit type 1 TsaB [Chloroflexota bacterium]